MRVLLAMLALVAVISPGASATGVTPELAFVADGDIWVGNADGSGAVRLAAPGSDRAPAWSPDGSRIAFESTLRLSVMNADGSGRRTIEDGNAVSLAWSRDGRRLAFTRQGQGPGVELRVADPNGSGSVRLATVLGGSIPAWTATHRIVAAVLENGRGVIRSIDPETGASFRIDDGVAPSVSPDGVRVAYIRAAAQRQALYVAAVDGAGARRVSQRPAAWETLAWSPDATEIAFVGFHAGYMSPPRGGVMPTDSHPDLYVVDVATGITQRLTGHPEEPAPLGAPLATAPGWWPDGSRLFVTLSGMQSVVNVDGSCAQPFQPVERASQFSWRPGAMPELPELRCTDLWSRFEPFPTVVGRGAELMVAFSVTNVGNEPATAQLRVDALRNGVVTQWSVPTGVCAAAPTCELGTIEPDDVVRVAVVVRAGSPGVLSLTPSASGPADPTAGNNGQRIDVAVSTCRIVGTSTADEIVGTSRADSICGLTGPDRIEGRKGNDLLDGGGGTDTILGGDGRDRIEGRGGRDVIVVRDGLRDVVACGPERDTVVADRKDVVARDCERVLRR